MWPWRYFPQSKEKSTPPHHSEQWGGILDPVAPFLSMALAVSSGFKSVGIHRVSSGFTIFRKACIRPLLHPMDGILDPVASFLSMALAVSSGFEAYFSSYGSIFKRI